MATLYSNADASENNFVLVETQDGGGAAFNPTAVTIPSGYKDIVISGNVLGTGVAGMFLRLYFNGDTTDTNYRTQYFASLGTTRTAAEWSAPYIFYPRSATGEGTESTGGFSATIPDYSNAVNRAVASSVGITWKEVDSLGIGMQWDVIWRDSTAAITSIIFDADSTLAAGSSFTVWVR